MKQFVLSDAIHEELRLFWEAVEAVTNPTPEEVRRRKEQFNEIMERGLAEARANRAAPLS